MSSRKVVRSRATSESSETAVAGNVKWEFSNSTLGYSYGPAVVTKTAQYGWVVILTSGYDNSDGVGRFYFLDPKTGTLLQTVSTGVGSASTPSGLAFATPYVSDYSVGTADALYAGDLLGNVWRVDMTPKTGSYSVFQIARATDSGGVAQPITTRPLVEQAGANSAYRFVVVGTGKTLASTDITSSQTNTIYTIYDGLAPSGGFLTTPNTGTYPVTRQQAGQLIQNTNITTQNASINTGIAIATPPVKMGWYVDLTPAAIPGLTAPAAGYAYQVDVQSSANNGIAGFGINAASGSACSPAGIGAILAFSIAGGASVLDASTSGAYMATSRVSDVTFYNNNSTGIGIAAGVANPNDPSPIKQPPCSGCAPPSTIQKLNWREIPSAN